jgi:hypothetical protein
MNERLLDGTLLVVKPEDLGSLTAVPGAAVVVTVTRDESVNPVVQGLRDGNALGIEALKQGEMVQVDIVPA